ncbi:MAG: prephenate dehydrogenase [Deltaproteobacteria bacterium]|nr:prephenate dehydrogenase [Deltaproteobacteria bacterium]
MFKRAFIIGTGLIGGSLAIAFKKRKLVKEILGYDRSLENLNKAESLGIIDRQAELKEVNECDLVIVSVPVLSIPSVLLSVFPMLKKGAYILDVGSVKGYVVEKVENKIPPGIDYVPLHPVAGKEISGPESAEERLFEGRTVVITPIRNERWKKIEELIEAIGAVPIYMDYKLHDELFAISSHIPHILSFANVNLLREMNVNNVRFLIGTGFKDFTRIAKSNEEIWADIVIANKHYVLKAMERLFKGWSKIKKAISCSDRAKLTGLWREARLFREKLDG